MVKQAFKVMMGWMVAQVSEVKLVFKVLRVFGVKQACLEVMALVSLAYKAPLEWMEWQVSKAALAYLDKKVSKGQLEAMEFKAFRVALGSMGNKELLAYRVKQVRKDFKEIQEFKERLDKLVSRVQLAYKDLQDWMAMLEVKDKLDYKE
jgi:hypothetical protein